MFWQSSARSPKFSRAPYTSYEIILFQEPLESPESPVTLEPLELPELLESPQLLLVSL